MPLSLPPELRGTEPRDALSVSSKDGSWLKRPLKVFRDLFVPSNYPHSVSKDYESTRKWQLARDVAGSVSWGYAAGMAVSMATVPGLAAAGLSLFTYGLVKERLSQAVGFVSSSFTPLASRNPRAWMLAGDMLDSAGVAVLSGAALCPPAFSR